ncbi:MAG: hypothetical protein JNM90_23885 [Burkholderiales bacterium]|nr:hypothetical protein [Burkholderiales bacterium]
MKVIGFALATLVAAALANLVVDPMGIFFAARLPGVNRYKPEVLNYWHIALPLRAHLVRPQVAVLGSSRVLAGIDTRELAGDRPAANLGLPGATLCDVADAFEVAAAGGRLERVVIGLDFFAANAARIPADCGLREALHHPWRLLVKTTFSSDTLNASLKTATKQHRVDPAIWQPTAHGTALIDPGHTARRGGMRRMFGEIEDIYARDYYLVRPACRFELAPTEAARAGLEHLRRLLRGAHARGVEVRMFFSPEHARLIGLARAAGLIDAYRAWLRAVDAVNREEAARAGRSPFVLIYPFDPAWVGEPVPAAGDLTEPRHFIDGSHYTPAVGRRIVGLLADARSGDLEAGFARALAATDAYLTDRPEDAAEIAAAVRRAREACPAGRP